MKITEKNTQATEKEFYICKILSMLNAASLADVKMIYAATSAYIPAAGSDTASNKTGNACK